MHLPKYVIHKLIKMTKSLYIEKELFWCIFNWTFTDKTSQIKHTSKLWILYKVIRIDKLIVTINFTLTFCMGRFSKVILTSIQLRWIIIRRTLLSLVLGGRINSIPTWPINEATSFKAGSLWASPSKLKTELKVHVNDRITRCLWSNAH